MKKFLLFVGFTFFYFSAHCQDTALVPVKFHFPNGKVSSEGFLRDGKPDSYWKSYYESGFVKSEGNRKDFLLDGIWKFYADSNRLNTEIMYKRGMKNGEKITYNANEKLIERFVDDVKEGFSEIYYLNGRIKSRLFYEKGLANGQTLEYDSLGNVQSIFIYKRGFLVSREIINRYDKNNLKTGLWKSFFEDGSLKEEVYYRNGLKNGFLKKYNEKGTLILIEKYVNDIKEENVAELKEYEIRKDYFANGKPRIIGSYYNGKPDGIRREYDENGKVIIAYIFENGIRKSEGIIDNSGNKQGSWTDFHEDGSIKAKGKYLNGNRVGEWSFFYSNGKMEQQGTYTSKGKSTGEWKRWNENGILIKVENFENGILSGEYVEYNDTGKVAVQGVYEEGMEQGKWMFEIGDISQTIEYQDGVMMGWWIQKDILSGELIYQGKYMDDEPTGKHTWYFPNGKKRLEGFYSQGVRDGEWKYFSEDGQIFLSVTYSNGTEIKYNSSLLK